MRVRLQLFYLPDYLSIVIAESFETLGVRDLIGLDILDKRREYPEAAQDQHRRIHRSARHAPVASNTKPRNTGVMVCADMLAV